MSALIWAHRGASAYAPENTLPAFEMAAEMGADGVELDVHMSRDGQLIVAHDETVDRCSSGTGRIADMTLQELRELDFSAHKPGFRGTRVPTLEEVYALLRPTGLTINVEIKSGVVLYEGIEQRLIELGRAAGMEDRIYYSSFNHYSLMLLKSIAPAARIAPLYSAAFYEPWHYARQIGAQAIHPLYHTLMAPGFMQGANASGVLVNAWTVDDPKEIAWLNGLGVNAIITNVPDVALRVRKG